MACWRPILEPELWPTNALMHVQSTEGRRHSGGQAELSRHARHCVQGHVRPGGRQALQGCRHGDCHAGRMLPMALTALLAGVVSRAVLKLSLTQCWRCHGYLVQLFGVASSQVMARYRWQPSHRLRPHIVVSISSGLGCLQEHDDSWVTDLPEGMHFVTPDWVSGCLAQGRLLAEHTHLISIARMVMLARLQVSTPLADVRPAWWKRALACCRIAAWPSDGIVAWAGEIETPFGADCAWYIPALSSWSFSGLWL